ncbi:MAG TPA: CHAT domain-containing tetratricopeptide repeat protein [Vicinamibacterales bacterium]|nr:CHAT domain-containing tetratricopeptide repeat protein [Vicinamibacterales bacterium]
MRRTSVWTVAAIVGALAAPSAATSGDPLTSAPAPIRARRVPDVSPLPDGRIVERRLERGDDHQYRVPLSEGEYLRVIVEQHGIDLVAQTRDAANAPIADFDDEIRHHGQEQVELVAAARGVYTIAIAAPPDNVDAGGYRIRVAVRRAATEADRTRQQARRLRATADRLETAGRFDAARQLLLRALTIAETAWGADNLQTAAAAAQLAGLDRKLAHDVESESLYQRAIAIADRTLGADHPSGAAMRSELAALYQHQGERRKAEALLRQALDVIERTLGPDHPRFVSGLITLGNLRDDAGDLEAEEAIVRRALAVSETTGDTDSVQYAELLNNLGEVYRQKQDYGRAEDLLRRSLALGERVTGPDSYFNATALQNLGIIARERKDYATAIAYNTRALAIRERMVGTGHPDVAHILTNLANIYRATGDYTRALETHLRALHIWEHAAGPYREATLKSVGNIAKTYAAAGDLTNAIASQRRADAIVEKQLALNLAVGSERQKLAFVASVSERTDRTISLHLDRAPGSQDAGALAALVLLQRKGRVQDAMVDALAAVRQRVVAPADRALLDRLRDAMAELARLTLSTADEERREERRRALAQLEARKEQLEATLSDHSAEFRAQMQPVTLEAVRAAIPDDAALLEFAVFRPFDPTAERNAEAYGPPHYAAYVIRKLALPRGVDLGPAAAIDQAIEALRQSLRDPHDGGVTARARAVDDRVMRPLRPWLGAATRLLVSPDGDLNLVPFEALIDEEGRYLIERYATSYLTTGRDLLRMQGTRAIPTRPVIVADPRFGEPPAAESGRPPEMYFAPLSATGMEARAIKALFPDAALFTGASATKATLQAVRGPRILHIASHGFFLDDSTRDAGNPLLRSGLALAGANLTHDGDRGGILTALEASGLDLWGTQLVTLSACDTGIGEVRNGEGVYGLRRAFVLAGAETLVMSLWPVSDFIARDTIVAYYTGLGAGLGRGDALRQAKLALLRRANRGHPFYWAGFIQSGEWAGLDGAR